MSRKRVERHLAAIVCADVAGYSRLMGEDEVATLRALNECLEIITRLSEEHHGRVVSSPGDAVLAEFASVVEAVDCSVKAQKELAARNQGQPEARKMRFRIGINVGDVIVETDQIYGDGVNIAARLESLAPAGGICISGAVYEQVKRKLKLGYEYRGEQTVRNITDPVPAYFLHPDPDHVPTGPVRTPLWALPLLLLALGLIGTGLFFALGPEALLPSAPNSAAPPSSGGFPAPPPPPNGSDGAARTTTVAAATTASSVPVQGPAATGPVAGEGQSVTASPAGGGAATGTVPSPPTPPQATGAVGPAPASPAGSGPVQGEAKEAGEESEPEIIVTARRRLDGATQDRINELLTVAERYLEELRLTSPSPGNALDTYRRILELDPDNEEARTGLLKIRDAYILLARKAIGRNDLDQAEKYLEKAEEIVSQDKRVQAVRERIAAERAAEAEKGKREVEERELTRSSVDARQLPQSIINSLGMRLVLCRPGTFLRGSPPEAGFKDERPAGRVTISKPFYIGVYEVTQGQYRQLTGQNPSHYRDPISEVEDVSWRPVERVDWKTAQEFCEMLTTKEKVTYRLPTEAEWEYACQAGGPPLPAIGVQGRTTFEVGQRVNQWQIHDMQGNVWEWCSDWYAPDYYATGPLKDPQGPAKGSEKIIRGGSHNSDDATQGSTRSNFRGHSPPHLRSSDIGFRVVMEPR